MDKVKLFKTDILGFRKKEVANYITQTEEDRRIESDKLRGTLQNMLEDNKLLRKENEELKHTVAKLLNDINDSGESINRTTAVLNELRLDYEKLKYDYDTLKYVYESAKEQCAAINEEAESIKNSILHLPFVQKYIAETANDPELSERIDAITQRIDAILSQT